MFTKPTFLQATGKPLYGPEITVLFTETFKEKLFYIIYSKYDVDMDSVDIQSIQLTNKIIVLLDESGNMYTVSFSELI